MNPDDAVLIVLLNNARDLELVELEQWYRIPARHAPRLFSGAQYLAFYLARAFGERKWTIAEYAPVRGHELVRRRDLFPGEPMHPRAEEHYYKVQLGPLQRREPPIVSKRGRRILFLWTTWSKFSTAREINDLINKGPAEEKLWDALKTSNLDAERDFVVHEKHSRYRVDFLIYCPRGRVAVTIDRPPPVHSTQNFRAVAFSLQDLEDHFERVLDEIKFQTHELGTSYHIQEAQV